MVHSSQSNTSNKRQPLLECVCGSPSEAFHKCYEPKLEVTWTEPVRKQYVTFKKHNIYANLLNPKLMFLLIGTTFEYLTAFQFESVCCSNILIE